MHERVDLLHERVDLLHERVDLGMRPEFLFIVMNKGGELPFLYPIVFLSELLSLVVDGRCSIVVQYYISSMSFA